MKYTILILAILANLFSLGNFSLGSIAYAQDEVICTEEQSIVFDARIVDAVYDSDGNLIGEDVAVCDYKAAPVQCEEGSPRISSRMQNKEEGAGFTCHVLYVCCAYE